MKTTTDYQGWKNRATWNVALWINNDYNLYESAKFFVKANLRNKKLYADFVRWCGLSGTTTEDGFKWDGQQLDYKALNSMMRELAEH